MTVLIAPIAPTPQAFIAEVRRELVALGDPQRAAGQQAYMKSEMPFHGVPMPDVKRLARALAKRYRLDLDQISEFSQQLWDAATHREERHVALRLTELRPALGRLELVALYEYQARSGAWWDYVDEIAHRIVCLHDAHPVETAEIVRKWSLADTFWLRRLAIISQLRRKERTDVALLAQVIEPNLLDGEFFIRKAIGWALRDFAYTDPDWVRDFVATHELSPLSRREALKHIG